ncbi:hypothetical protein GYMLUDRAFT_249753 [Collybiopsis luxurians FD-317 M1]|uniref:Uncharacterized protein n=1 Tax=Collybiopsis luxurians FD-317 M1 TaxID=944289 RepID=A0A0D0BWP6_9AGAR|nr:hypothetical protein GYMLUDRAFT_249753 [Collybiopsis luxurians FD-317 M1]
MPPSVPKNLRKHRRTRNEDNEDNEDDDDNEKEDVPEGDFGYVEGLGRGSVEYKLARTHPLPLFLSDTTKSSRRYGRAMPLLFKRLEHLCVETGCWMYLVTALPNGHLAFQHFTSQRLLDEPDQSLLDNLHRTAARAVTSLQRSRRMTTQELAADNHDKELENEELRAQKAALEKELKQQRELLGRLQDSPNRSV